MNWNDIKIEQSDTRTTINLPGDNKKIVIFYKNIQKKDLWKIKQLIQMFKNLLNEHTRPSFLQRLLKK